MTRLVSALALATPSFAFYLPGVAPTEYQHGGSVDLKVNTLTSVKTQLPYRYYYLPYCVPEKIHVVAENLGEILMGDSVESSMYEIGMNVNSSCVHLCDVTLTKEDRTRIKNMIDDDYHVNWLVDSLPATSRELRKGLMVYRNGFPVGGETLGKYSLHNHVSIHLQYHEHHGPTGAVDSFRVVGFEVEPSSIANDEPGCNAGSGGLDIDATDHVKFTYDVVWSPSDVRWSSRWDSYLKMGEGKVHWFSIINSLLIVLFLSGMVALILLRTLHRDIALYNEIVDESTEETGWKLVHGDVFRKPIHSKMLAVSAGTGVQLLICVCVTLVFSALGFLSPVHRGSILQGMLLLFSFAGCLGGYTSARFYKTWKGEDWKTTTLWTAFLYPGFVFFLFFILNLFIWGMSSSGAVPFFTMFAILVLWFGISVPLVFLGAFLGYKKAPISLPVSTNQIPRQIPAQPFHTNFLFSCIVGGILPFGAVSTELFFLMSSIWQHQFYYLFGFLMLMILILVVTCAEIAITLVYFQLSSEDYNWGWRSFWASGSSAVYVFLSALHYYFYKLSITNYVGTMLYFGYMFIGSVAFAMVTGTIGFMSTFLFLRSIYGSIKID